MAKEIILYGGYITIVDDDLYEELSLHKWHLSAQGYATTGIYVPKDKTHQIVMHKMILGNYPKGLQVDHINQNKLDNRKSNLRLVNASQNKANVKQRSPDKYKGVYFCNKTNKYSSHIKKDYVKYHLGSFDNAVDAAIAYNKKAMEFFGEFACLNKID